MDARRGKDASVFEVGEATGGILIAEVFTKKTGKTPKSVIETCKTRLREYNNG